MDMGTSNTRVWLYDKDRAVCERREHFGARLSITEGKSALFERLSRLIRELLAEAGVAEADVECLITSGMSGSEFGLYDLPHIAAPTDVRTLAEGIFTTSIPEVTDIPIWIVPGVKSLSGEQLCDTMRGEETEAMGILDRAGLKLPCVMLLPGTHNKVIRINERGEISNHFTTASGEILDLIITNSILSGSVSHSFEPSPYDILRGSEHTRERGMNAAVYHVRTMKMRGEGGDSLSSFLYGAVLGADVEAIKLYAHGDPIYIGGNRTLAAVYYTLLRTCSPCLIDSTYTESAVPRGLTAIYKIVKAEGTRAAIKAAIEKNKVISIVRSPEKQTLFKAVEALYEGGIRLLEVTFDRSGKISAEETADTIAKLNELFRGRMYIGAGTVTDTNKVKLAADAGASFIISPNCDPSVIKLTRKLGLISIPAAFTATEIAAAIEHGADYIKLFPADAVSREYVKAVTAPLSDAKLLAVGGVTPESTRTYLESVFLGVGVGSNLYNKKLIAEGDFAALTALAREYIMAAVN